MALGRVGEGELVDFLVSENKKIKTYTVNTKEPNKAFGLKVTLKKATKPPQLRKSTFKFTITLTLITLKLKMNESDTTKIDTTE